jgi:hypothetical protein
VVIVCRLRGAQSALQDPLADTGTALSRENWRPMNSTRSALPAFMSDCEIAVSSADASMATRCRGRRPR